MDAKRRGFGRRWRPSLRFGAIFLFSIAPLTPASAAFVIETKGMIVVELGDIPAGFAADWKAAHPADPSIKKVGFRYRHRGFFNIALWTWDGEFCLIDAHERSGPISRRIAAELLGIHEGDLKPPFSYRFPPGRIIVVGSLLLGFGVTILEIRARRRLARLSADPLYRKALAAMAQSKELAGGKDPIRDPAAEDGPDPVLEAGVRVLVAGGIPAGEARRDLEFLAARGKDAEPEPSS